MLLLAALVVMVILAIGLLILFPGKIYLLAMRMEWARCGLEERSVDLDGLHISYLTGGKGEPLLLLHGFGGGKEHWMWVAKHLVEHFRVIAPDLPGCGSSTSDLGLDYSVEKQAERVHAFSQALGLKSLHVGGNSMGGSIAVAFAARYPEATMSLWLLAPGGVESAEPSERDVLMEKGDNILIARTADDFGRIFELCFVKPPRVPGFVRKYLAKRAVACRELSEKIYHDLMDHAVPLEGVVSDLHMPTLILWGDHDRLTHVSGAAILESLMPNARAIVMENMGHVPMVERPELSARYYLEFQGKTR